MSAIRRSPKNKDNPFVMIDRRLLDDTRLTLRAKGLMAYILSRPDNWEVNVQHLIRQAKDGRDAHYAVLRELISLGYCERIITRVDGKISSVDYEIIENPSFLLPEKPEVEPGQLPEKPDTVKPDTEKPDVNNKDFNDTENQENEILSISFDDDDDNEVGPAAGTDKTTVAMATLPTYADISAMTAYIQNIAPQISPLESEMVGDLIDTHGEDHMKQAISRAVCQNVRTLKYVTSIIENAARVGYDFDRGKPNKTGGNQSKNGRSKKRQRDVNPRTYPDASEKDLPVGQLAFDPDTL